MADIPETDIHAAYYHEKKIKYTNHEKAVTNLNIATEEAMRRAFRFVSLPHDMTEGMRNK